MKLSPPTRAPGINCTDVNGKPVSLSDKKHPTLLCFFRDPACPFCNLRIYELTQRYDDFAVLGLNIVAVFSAKHAAVERFITKRPRPFQVVAQPVPRLLEDYGIEWSLRGKLKAIATRIPELLKGLRFVGLHGLNTSNQLPADFLLNENGYIIEAWYGSDAGDRIPFERIEAFLARNLARRHNNSPQENVTLTA